MASPLKRTEIVEECPAEPYGQSIEHPTDTRALDEAVGSLVLHGLAVILIGTLVVVIALW